MRVLALVMLVVGVVLLLFGLNSTQAVSEKVVEGFTGRFTGNTMWYIIGGVALIVTGGAILLFGTDV